MYISEIELKNYKRLSLNNIVLLKITPQQKFHWILGTNGSGKSSLLRELTPLAASSLNYHKGGYKKILLEHKGIKYKLISDFSGPKNLFNFIILSDNREVELNSGYTSTVYNNLVLQHFGITKDIHDLAIGKREFDSLSPNEKKVLLTKLSHTDYSFALNYFQKLLTIYRDTLGSIKTDQNRLIEAKTKLISKEEEKYLTEDILILKNKSKILFEICPNPSTPHNLVKQKLSLLREQMIQNSKVFRKRLQKDKVLLPLDKPEIIQDNIINLESEVKFLEESTKFTFLKLETIISKINKMQMVQMTNASTIQIEINKILKELIALEKTLIIGIDTDCAETLIENFDLWQRNLENIISVLTPDINNIYTSAYLEEITKEYNRGENFLAVVQSKKDNINYRILEIESCTHDEKVECPKCNYRWVPGKTPEDLENFKKELLVLQEKEKAAKLKMAGLFEIKENCSAHLNGLEYLNNFIWKNDIFKSFWEKILHEKIHKNNPSQILNEVFLFRLELNILKAIEEKQKILTDLENKKYLLNNQESFNIELLIEEHKTLDNEISKLYDRREEAIKQLNYIKQKKSLSDYCLKTIKETESWYEKIAFCFKDDFDHFYRINISEINLSINTEIMAKEKQLRSIEIQKAQVDILENNIKDFLEYSKVLKAAVNELSPSEGLIAKGLTGFINHFFGIVNSIIGKIWLYPMGLIPVMPNDENNIDLNYRFSVRVKDDIVPDLSECSSGQKEIINLAVKIAALIFLKLDDGPLVLDEFGARMDPAHKVSAFEAISNLLAASNFKQIFMITHFEGSYNSSLEADVTVLCQANLNLPTGMLFNQQTTIA